MFHRRCQNLEKLGTLVVFGSRLGRALMKTMFFTLFFTRSWSSISNWEAKLFHRRCQNLEKTHQFDCFEVKPGKCFDENCVFDVFFAEELIFHLEMGDLSKSMLSKCGEFDYFSKVGKWFPEYSQNVLDISLSFLAPWDPFLAIFVHIWGSRGTQKAPSTAPKTQFWGLHWG